MSWGDHTERPDWWPLDGIESVCEGVCFGRPPLLFYGCLGCSRDGPAPDPEEAGGDSSQFLTQKITHTKPAKNANGRCTCTEDPFVADSKAKSATPNLFFLISSLFLSSPLFLPLSLLLLLLLLLIIIIIIILFFSSSTTTSSFSSSFSSSQVLSYPSLAVHTI